MISYRISICNFFFHSFTGPVNLSRNFFFYFVNFESGSTQNLSISFLLFISFFILVYFLWSEYYTSTHFGLLHLHIIQNVNIEGAHIHLVLSLWHEKQFIWIANDIFSKHIIKFGENRGVVKYRQFNGANQ